MASNSKRNTRKNTVKTNVDDVILNGVLTVVEKHNKAVWLGTMTELNSALVRVLGRKVSGTLPRSPGALRVVINRVVNRLRSRSVSVRFGRTSDHGRTRFVRFAR